MDINEPNWQALLESVDQMASSNVGEAAEGRIAFASFFSERHRAYMDGIGVCSVALRELIKRVAKLESKLYSWDDIRQAKKSNRMTNDGIKIWNDAIEAARIKLRGLSLGSNEIEDDILEALGALVLSVPSSSHLTDADLQRLWFYCNHMENNVAGQNLCDLIEELRERRKRTLAL